MEHDETESSNKRRPVPESTSYRFSHVSECSVLVLTGGSGAVLCAGGVVRAGCARCAGVGGVGCERLLFSTT